MGGFLDKENGTGAALNGVAFALVVLLYQSVPGIGNYQWCVYGGFLLCVALGADKKRYVHFLCSIAVGYGWAFLYWNLGGWFMAAGIPRIIALVLGEFLCTTALLYVHLHLLKKTVFNVVPYIFLAVASIYAMGGMQNAAKCGLSVWGGMTLCIVYNIILAVILSKSKKNMEKPMKKERLVHGDGKGNVSSKRKRNYSGI